MANTFASQKYGNLNFNKAIGIDYIDDPSKGAISGAYFTDANNNVFQYIPESVVQKGTAANDGTQYYLPYFLDINNINKFGRAAEYVNLSSLPAGDILSKYGVGAKGFLVPASLGVQSSNGAVPKGWGNITGLSFKDGQVAYATTGRPGDQFGWVTNSGVGALPPPRRSGGLLGALESVGGALINAGPVIQLMAAITANPVLYGIAAGTAAGQGDLLGAALNMTGMAGSIPGIDASTAADLKATQSVLQVSSALKNGNPVAALSALGGLSGTAVPQEVVRGTQLLAINNALQKNDLKSLAIAVGNISNTPEIAYAGKAARVLEAIDSGDLKRVASSMNSFLPELRSAYKTADFASAFDKIGAALSPDEVSSIDQMLGTTAEENLNKSFAAIADYQAQAEGWNNSSEKDAAEKVGITDPEDYNNYLATRPPLPGPIGVTNTRTAAATPPTLRSISFTPTATQAPTEGALPTAEKVKLATPTVAAAPDAQYWQFNPSLGLPDTSSTIPGSDYSPTMLKPVDTTGGQGGETTQTAGTGQPGQPFEPGNIQQLGQLFGSLDPSLKNALVKSGNVGQDVIQAAQNPYPSDFSNMYGNTGTFAGGGSVGSTIANIQDALSYKPIAPMVEPMLKAAPVTDSASAKLRPLKHLRQSIVPSSPLGSSEGMAKGGLPSKYHEAMPDGHKPEFVTGLTGYYAGGRGTGQSDDIDAMLHDGDYVMDAEAVSALGDGSSKAGKDSLTHFLGQVPHKDGAAGKPVPAKIADGEFVLPESFVTALGGGDNKRGAKMLDEMRERLRSHKRSAPSSKIPPKAKSPLDYLEGAKG